MNEMIKEMLDEFNYDSFVSKGLFDDDLTDRYYALLGNYKILFEKYLMLKLPLKEMDNKIVNSGLAFVAIDNDNMDFYQRFSTMGLKYVYLRNNLYVNKLSNDEIDLLVNVKEDELNSPSDKLFQLIEDTYKDVIDAKPLGDDVADIYRKCYGVDSYDYWINSDELVIGVRYDEFADNGLGENDEWVDNYNNQLDFLANLMAESEKDCSAKLGIKVNFLYFDDASVMRTIGREKK